MEHKKCRRCGTEKPLSDFYKERRGKFGVRAICKTCFCEVTRDASRKWYSNNSEKAKMLSKRWKALNPEAVKRTTLRRYVKTRSTAKGRLNDNIRSYVAHSLQGAKASRHWEELVGYTVDQLRTHLEKKFTQGMNWENYGTYWHVDHKTPIVVFNFEKPEDIDFRLCWSLKNLRPLEAKQNISKGARIEKPFQPALLINIGG